MKWEMYKVNVASKHIEYNPLEGFKTYYGILNDILIKESIASLF